MMANLLPPPTQNSAGKWKPNPERINRTSTAARPRVFSGPFAVIQRHTLKGQLANQLPKLHFA